MRKVTHPEVGWEVLTQATGEVLTAEARSPGLHLGLLGVPEGFAPRDAEGWLYDVVGVTHESSVSRPPSRPLPALLDHALSGLLFSHAELWDQPGTPSSCSYAFVEGRGEIGFGWVGDARVSVWVDGEQRTPSWVTLRGEQGREARGWSIPSHHEVQVRISWCRSAADPGAGGAEVEASWGVEGGPASARAFPDEREPLAVVPVAEPRFAAMPVAEAPFDARPIDVAPIEVPPIDETPMDVTPLDSPPVAPAEAAAPEGPAGVHATEAAGPAAQAPGIEPATTDPGGAPEAVTAESPRPPTGFGGWLRNTFSWLTGRRERASDASESVAWMEEPVVVPTAGGAPEGEAPVAPEPVGGSRPAAAGSPTEAPVEPPATAEPLIPPTLEAEGAETTEPESTPAAGFEPPGSIVSIPPTPEPAELTSQALSWVDGEDPHAIDLPALAAPIPPGPPETPAEPAREEVELRIVDVTPDEPEAFTAPGPSVPLRLEGLQAWAESLPEPPAADADDGLGTLPPAAEETAPAAGAAAPPPEPASEAPSVLVASAQPYVAARPLHPAWPSPQELARPRWMPGRRHGLWIALVGALFAGGWLVGALQDDGKAHDASRRGALSQALSAVGLGGPRFVVQVNSRPPGAWISVDGENLTLRTPAAIEVPPGEHSIGLSFSEFGSASYAVRGRKGDRVPLDATLWGALEVFSPSEVGVVAVSVDGVPRGLAPLRVDSLSPGVHEVRFSGLDIPSWGQTVDIRVGETREILARAVQSPSAGVLQVEASFTDGTGTQPLKGAQVYIDGELRGVTPLTVDLPRGPHSVRLVHRGQEAPIQVIDLPGGNQRFAVFELGLDQDVPRISVEAPARVPRDRPAVLSATLLGVPASEVREMWLHVRMGEGAWRRYGMTLLKAPAGAAGVVTFPTAAFDAQGRARYYVSAQSRQGDETFTEIRSIALDAPRAH